jgi:hypothetical protein
MIPGARGIPAVLPPLVKPDFQVRTVRADGIGCTSQGAIASVTSECLAHADECAGHIEKTLQTGQCVKLKAGTEATIEAGSH